MPQKQAIDVKALERRKARGERMRGFLNSSLYKDDIKPFLDGTREEAIRASYSCFDTPNKLIACMAWSQCIDTIREALETTAKDADLDLTQPPEVDEGPDLTQ